MSPQSRTRAALRLLGRCLLCRSLLRRGLLGGCLCRCGFLGWGLFRRGLLGGGLLWCSLLGGGFDDRCAFCRGVGDEVDELHREGAVGFDALADEVEVGIDGFEWLWDLDFWKLVGEWKLDVGDRIRDLVGVWQLDVCVLDLGDEVLRCVVRFVVGADSCVEELV